MGAIPKSKIPQRVICPYCGRQAVFIDSAEVYGQSYGMIYMCWPCDAYVGCHKHTAVPLGRLADKELREMKKAAHAAFDPIWRHRHMSRKEAYSWLAQQMGLPEEETHIGMFDVPQCEQVVRISEEYKARVAKPIGGNAV